MKKITTYLILSLVATGSTSALASTKECTTPNSRIVILSYTPNHNNGVIQTKGTCYKCTTDNKWLSANWNATETFPNNSNTGKISISKKKESKASDKTCLSAFNIGIAILGRSSPQAVICGENPSNCSAIIKTVQNSYEKCSVSTTQSIIIDNKSYTAYATTNCKKISYTPPS